MSDQTKHGLGIQDIIGDKRDDILRLAAGYGVRNVRIFGSVARGEARPDSDMDLMVDFSEGSTIFDAVGLWQDLTEMMGRDVSVIGEDSPDDPFMQRILKDAIPL